MNQRVDGPCWSTAWRAILVFGGLFAVAAYFMSSAGSVVGLH